MPALHDELTPKEVVVELNKYIVGQEEAKKIVAVALRSRFRRRSLEGKIKEEIIPKNIIMIGPTGVGKTEIARRLARLVNSPFVKVEATKFTEVGYVGRDVDSIIRDLVESSVRIVKEERMKASEPKAVELAEEKLLDLLVPLPVKEKKTPNPLDFLFQYTRGGTGSAQPAVEEDNYPSELELKKRQRREMGEKLKAGELEDVLVEVELDDRLPPMLDIFSGMGMEEVGVNVQELFGNLMQRKKKKKKIPVRQARRILQQEEGEKLIDMDDVINEAVTRAEQSGIVFIDEIDKITGGKAGVGPDISREGVQRDILPIVEGSTVMTKYGPVKTNYMLFIAAGAFHVASPSDLIPELQGRFPVRVELQGLSREDFRRILTEPENALTRQYTALLGTEGVVLEFCEDGVDEIADTACYLNEEMENIGARRLHTIMEKLLEDVSFNAPELIGEKILINRQYVKNKIKDIVKNKDLSRYIL
ncbi:MAG: ATP-dependent protease ATPase subunit HslU [Bacillota bacterium]